MKVRAGLQKLDAIDINNDLKIFKAWVYWSIGAGRHALLL